MEPSGKGWPSPGTPALYALIIVGLATITSSTSSVRAEQTTAQSSYPLKSENAIPAISARICPAHKRPWRRGQRALPRLLQRWSGQRYVPRRCVFLSFVLVVLAPEISLQVQTRCVFFHKTSFLSPINVHLERPRLNQKSGK
jgi:hypothetical protein